MKNKEKVKAYNEKYRLTHREEAKAYSKEYRRTHTVKVRAYNREYYTRNRQKTIDRATEYWRTHKKEINARERARYATHPEVRKAEKDYRKAHQEEFDIYMRAYRAAHRDEIRKSHSNYTMVRRKVDLNFRIAANLRTRLNLAMKRNQQAGSAVRDLGITILEFRDYIERLWKPGMAWENYGTWHLDHVRPLSSFDLTDRKQFLLAAHYTNYQPLWAHENIVKRNK